MIAHEYDGIDLAYPASKLRRGRVIRGGSHTIQTGGNEGTMINGKIRKLTPRECFALQGFKKEQCDMLAEHGMSNTQLYKQAGNSICIPVLAALFGAMKEQGMFDKYITMPLPTTCKRIG